MRRAVMTAMDGPVAQAMRAKLTEKLKPTQLEIINDSARHADHEPMRGVESTETHFMVTIVSDEFQGKPLTQRHRLVYSVLADEFAQGLHALNISAKTPSEMPSPSAKTA